MSVIKIRNEKRIGQIFKTTDGNEIEIIEYFNFKNVTVKFLNDNTIIKNLQYGHIKNGNVRNKNKLSHFGIGKIGIGKFDSNNQKNLYIQWTNMLARCYSENYQKNQPTYIGCSVDKNWHNFQNFVDWAINFDNGYELGYELDKDLLFENNKIYSPETCIFIPKEINILLTKIKNSKYVTKNLKKNNYFVYVTKFGKQKFFGSFNSEEEAILEGKKQKLNYIKEVAILWKDKIHQKVYEKLINIKIEDLI